MPETMTKSLRIPREILKEIEQEFRNRDFSSVANELRRRDRPVQLSPG